MTPYFDDVMAPLVAAVEALKPTRLVGASGSFDTLAEMAGTRTKRERPDHAQTPESHPGVDPIPMEAFSTLAQQLVEGDVHHRAAMPGMDPARVDLMPFSVALIEWVLGLGEFKDMVKDVGLETKVKWAHTHTCTFAHTCTRSISPPFFALGKCRTCAST